MTKPYSLKKCKTIFKDAVLRHKKLAKRLSSELMDHYEKILDSLDDAITHKDIDTARLKAFEVEAFLHEHGKKSLFEKIQDFSFAIIFALIIATLVRQMWFELYEIPSGSMRPTFRESDRVLVFKDTFCINKPLQTSHFYFNPEYVKRGTIVVLTGDGLDMSDVDTVYFGLFPGKRRYVKRSVAKDGDQIFFYGGKLYGIDKDDKPLDELLTNPYLQSLEYIPFISFDGKVDKINNDTFILRHMNIPVAMCELTARDRLNGSMIDTDKTFSELWGMGNFAMSRILTPDDLPSSANILGYANADAKLYLELKHSPKLPTNEAPDDGSFLATEHSWIPLDHDACNRIKDALYTARFYVRKGTCFRYTENGPDLSGRGLFLDRKIPDGCYEFIDGVAYEIGWGAITHALTPDHPIYPHSYKMLKALYNSGIDFSNATNMPKKYPYFPARYTYFRDGELYTLGKRMFTGDEVTRFTEKELAREKLQRGYTPFIDHGAPLKDGQIDIDFIKDNGLQINDAHYLLLGDNHAMSNDSRFFGAVPQKNLEGSPALIFWPPGDRFGPPPQPSIPYFRVSNVVVVSSVIVLAWISFFIYNRRTSRESYKKRVKK